MILFIREYSFLIAALGLAFAAGLILLTNRPKWENILAFGLIVGALFACWYVLHPIQTPLMGDAQSVRSLIGTGTPVLLEFQSPYCILCTQIKPGVDKLEQELNRSGKQIHIIRLNIQEPAGKELAPVYRFGYPPTFVFLDAQGRELWRTVGVFDPQQVRDSLR